MANVPVRQFKVSGQWALNANVTIPPVPVSGQSYRKADITRADAEKGQAYDMVFESSRNNQKCFESTGIAQQVSKYGIVPWSPLEDYVGDASFCMGTNGEVYRAVEASGPNTSYGVQDPVADEAHEYWIEMRDWIGANGEYLAEKTETDPETLGETAVPTSNTLMKRNEDGRCQVQDALEPLDAINLRQAQKLMANAGGYRAVRPVITSPEDGESGVPMAVEVTTTELAVTGNQAPAPVSSQYRVRELGGGEIYDSGIIPYTTTHEVTFAEIAHTYYIEVRHRDEYCGWSAWSEEVEVQTTTTGTVRPRALSPVNGATGELPTTTLTISALEVAGADADPVASQFRIADNENMGAMYDSGEIDYTTTYGYAPEPKKRYWWQARHKDATYGWTPWSPLVRFVSANADVPDISGLTHNIPSVADPETIISNIQISGATVADGSGVTYKLRSIVGGLIFSKNADIEDNDVLSFSAPATSSKIDASLNIVAVSGYGIESEPVPVSVTIMKTSWLITSSGTWTAPVAGKYNIYCVGGGGAGGLASCGGGGGGVLYKNISIDAGSYSAVIGAGGINGSLRTGIASTGGGETKLTVGGNKYTAGGGGSAGNTTKTGKTYEGGGGGGGSSGTGYSGAVGSSPAGGKGGGTDGGAGGSPGIIRAGNGVNSTGGSGGYEEAALAANNGIGTCTLSFPGKGNYGDGGYCFIQAKPNGVKGCIYIVFI